MNAMIKSKINKILIKNNHYLKMNISKYIYNIYNNLLNIYLKRLLKVI